MTWIRRPGVKSDFALADQNGAGTVLHTFEKCDLSSGPAVAAFHGLEYHLFGCADRGLETITIPKRVPLRGYF